WSMRIDDELIDGTLRSEPVWQPPAGLAERIAARGLDAMHGQPPVPRLWSWINLVAAVPLAVVAAVLVYLAGSAIASVAPALTAASASTAQAAWVWVAVSCGVAAWFVRDAYAAD